MTENPLQFLEEFSNESDEAAARVNQLATLLPTTVITTTATTSMVSESEQQGNNSENQTATSSIPATATLSLERLNKACRRDMSFLPPAINDVKSQVDRIKTNIHKLTDTLSCGQISPLLRRVSHGAICVESPYGLTILWSTSFGIGILCFVLLTVRAALYNSVKNKKRRPTKPRRIVEKEFEEYKDFMGKYYGGDTTKEWKIDGVPLPPTKLEFEFDKDLEMKGTFETSDNESDEDDGSENAGIHIRGNEYDDSSYGSSYDSEISDDDENDEDSSINSSEDGDEQSSAIGSFISDTRSIAMQTIHSLRNIKSLLSSSARKSSHRHADNTKQYHDDNNNDDADGEDRSIDDAALSFPKKLGTVFDNDKYNEGGDDDDDDESRENSISDDSMYLPTPVSISSNTAGKISPLRYQARAGAAGILYKKKTDTSSTGDSYCDKEEDDEDDKNLTSRILIASNRLKQAWTPLSVISALSPAAPRKAFSFLARTLYTGDGNDDDYFFDEEDYSEEELNSLVRPKQLSNLTHFQSRDQDTTFQDITSKKTNNKPKEIQESTILFNRESAISVKSENHNPSLGSESIECPRESLQNTKDEKKTILSASSFSSEPSSSQFRDAAKRKKYSNKLAERDSTSKSLVTSSEPVEQAAKTSAYMPTREKSSSSASASVSYAGIGRKDYSNKNSTTNGSRSWPTDAATAAATSTSTSLQRSHNRTRAWNVSHLSSGNIETSESFRRATTSSSSSSSKEASQSSSTKSTVPEPTGNYYQKPNAREMTRSRQKKW